MIDPKLLRSDIASIAAKLLRRGFQLDVQALAALEERRKQVQVRTQELQAERNAKSKAIGSAKAKGEDTLPLMQAVTDLGIELKQAETDLEQIQKTLGDGALVIPNLPHDSVPDGKDE